MDKTVAEAGWTRQDETARFQNLNYGEFTGVYREIA